MSRRTGGGVFARAREAEARRAERRLLKCQRDGCGQLVPLSRYDGMFCSVECERTAKAIADRAHVTCACGTPLVRDGVTVAEHWIGDKCDRCAAPKTPKTIDLMQALKDCLATARAADTNPPITDRIARFRVTRIESHVVEGMHSLGEVWEAIDLLAGPDEKCEHIVGVRNDEAFCFRDPDFGCDAPIAVQHARGRLAPEEPAP